MEREFNKRFDVLRESKNEVSIPVVIQIKNRFFERFTDVGRLDTNKDLIGAKIFDLNSDLLQNTISKLKSKKHKPITRVIQFK